MSASSEEEDPPPNCVAQNVGVFGSLWINDLDWLGEQVIMATNDQERFDYWKAFEVRFLKLVFVCVVCCCCCCCFVGWVRTISCRELGTGAGKPSAEPESGNGLFRWD